MPEAAIPFSPVVGETYTQHKGAAFKCIRLGRKKHTPIMQNVKSGWVIAVHDVEAFPDGSIDWGHSTDGHFEVLQ